MSATKEDKQKKDREAIENHEKSKQPSSKPSKPAFVPSKPAVVAAKPASREDEILSILQQIRIEQKESNRRIDDMDRRMAQMESYDDYEYDPVYHDCEETDSYREEPQNESESRKRKSEGMDLGDSHFASMAKRFKTVEICDNEIEPVLADNINELFLKGMDEEQYSEIIKDEKTPRPSNCEGLVTVKLNQLIWDIVSANARSRDKKLQNIETSCIKSACILAKAADMLARIDAQALKTPMDGVNDAIALFGHTNKQLNMFHRDLLKPELRNEYSHLCTHALPYTRQLFGDDVSKTAKEIEECSKMGYKLQHGSNRAAYSYFRPRGGRVRGRGLTRRFRGRGSSDYTSNYIPSKNFRRAVRGKRM